MNILFYLRLNICTCMLFLFPKFEILNIFSMHSLNLYVITFVHFLKT